MNNITAVVLTLNEGPNMERCLASLQWCDAVVVLDSGSKDNTEAESKRLGAKFFVHQQTPPFRNVLQRNWALDQCGIESEWVLFLDADETVSDALRDEIIQSCATADEAGYNAYELTPRYLFWGTWLKRTQGYPNWHPRLMKRSEVRFTGGVWEAFDEAAVVGQIDIPYDHYANSKGFSDWLERHDRYSSFDAEMIVDFLESGSAESLNTSRKLKLRLLAARFWPLRPVARFCHMYLGRLGFLEGRAAFVFCLLYAYYEFMTVVKIIELKRTRKGLPL
ncbi:MULTISPECIES: glycosyltransferase family 2 protein [unclassified Lentimonas]|uniref:glycosyltransferase family 2 protein n=1 Tax=unclassified Lentimonas TaxID=2630993 RepID=UPI00132671F6|nr:MULTISPECIES: glycosyltransferase family 2 protein [unclassified Lentimonas]CAA6693595.1 Unannotated [Lentimonas sp. CC10]CAA6696863.1 Unannotated [Lentimonas sp. CC19]CAA7071174.1 Unannotated [Lentimonas sp. CC11]